MVRAATLIVALSLSGCGIAFTSSQKLENEAKEAVSRNMKDPASSEFRSLDVFADAGVVCGEVNSKNSFGAMAGFEGFVYDNGKVWIASNDKIEFARASVRCADASLDQIDPSGRTDRALAKTEAEIERIMAKIPEGREKEDLRKQIDQIRNPPSSAPE